MVAVQVLGPGRAATFPHAAVRLKGVRFMPDVQEVRVNA